MTNISPAVSSFIQACVAEGKDDWIPPREVFVNARLAAERYGEPTRNVLNTGLSEMILGGYFEVGEVLENSNGGGLVFLPKNLTKGEALSFLEQYYANDIDPNDMSFEFWLNLTEEGQSLARN